VHLCTICYLTKKLIYLFPVLYLFYLCIILRLFYFPYNNLHFKIEESVIYNCHYITIVTKIFINHRNLMYIDFINQIINEITNKILKHRAAIINKRM